jgi:hypothetical protein
MTIEPPYSDDKFVVGITGAATEGYGVLFIDSLSHSWTGTLDYKSTLDSRGGNSYTNWGAAGKKFNNVIAAALQSKIHVIASLRSKMEYVLETDLRGKQLPRKIGLAPVMRDGIEYEFGVVFDLGPDHCCTVSKDRTNLFIDSHFQITEQTGVQLLEWLHSASEPEPIPTPQERLADALVDIDPETLTAYLLSRGVSSDGSILAVSDSYAQKALLALSRLKEAIEKFRQEAALAEPVTTQAEN